MLENAVRICGSQTLEAWYSVKVTASVTSQATALRRLCRACDDVNH